MADLYAPDHCDLCGSRDWSSLPMHEYAYGMWSDSRMSPRPLRKRVCTQCGLVRDGNAFSAEELSDHYADAYQLNTVDETCEHHFFVDGRALARSEAIARWMFDALGPPDRDRPVSSIYEVGAGQGRLLRRFAAQYPHARIAGCEPNRRAAAVASRDWFQVTAGDERTMDGVYDLIVASFVLEHVPSPTTFLRRLAAHLSPSGRLVVAQPMQDVESHDIYFVDHLHHFSVTHVDWAANRAGLVTLATRRAPWFAPNASVHVLTRGDVEPAVSYVAPAAIARAVARWEAVFASCRALPPRRYALFGGSEFAGLLRCYGALERLDLRIVLDDMPERYPDGVFGRPVRSLDALTGDEDERFDAVILALNPVYHASVARRCAARGFAVVNPFAAAQSV